MPQFNIDAFRSNFDGGYRGYLFYIYINNPTSTLGMEKTAYLVSSSATPTGTIEPIETNWQGNTFKFGSTHTYDEWTVTFKVDKNVQVWKDFLEWQKLIHDPETNIQGVPSDYLADQTVVLLDSTGSAISTSKLYGAWPSSVGEIALDYESKEVGTFDVTFNYQYALSE